MAPKPLLEGTPEVNRRGVSRELVQPAVRTSFGGFARLFGYSERKEGGNPKSDFGCRGPTASCVVEISEQTPAVSQLEVDLVSQKEQTTETVRISVRLMYSEAANHAVTWGHGTWKIVVVVNPSRTLR